MAGATFSRVKTWGAEVLTYADLNAEFDNIITNLTPAGVDDESASDAAARATTDPYPAGSLSKATSLQGELQQLRYMVNQLTGMTYWYQDPVGEIFIPASAMIPTVTAGAEPATGEYATNDVNLDWFAFDGASAENVCFSFVMPPDWDLGTIKAKFYWTGAAGADVGETVEWALKAVAVTNDGAMDTAYGTVQVISDTLLTAGGVNLHISGATPAITVGGTPAVGKMVNFKAYRNVGGTDDMDDDALLFGVLIQYKKGTTTVSAW